MREEVNIHKTNKANNYACLDLNELEDGTKIPILNEHNKFDIEKGLSI